MICPFSKKHIETMDICCHCGKWMKQVWKRDRRKVLTRVYVTWRKWACRCENLGLHMEEIPWCMCVCWSVKERLDLGWCVYFLEVVRKLSGKDHWQSVLTPFPSSNTCVRFFLNQIYSEWGDSLLEWWWASLCVIIFNTSETLGRFCAEFIKIKFIFCAW